MEITTIEDLRTNLRRCREITIYRRRHNYKHYMFVGYADEYCCHLYHYRCNLTASWFCPPAQIKKEEIFYASYNNDINARNIFDFNKGDTIVIENREDYPEAEDEENCIRRAEARLGETNYSIAYNNCESYVNWIFSGKNNSNQFERASKRNKIRIHLLDELICMGPCQILWYIFIFISLIMLIVETLHLTLQS